MAPKSWTGRLDKKAVLRSTLVTLPSPRRGRASRRLRCICDRSRVQDQQSWWLRRGAHLDDCGPIGLPLPQARARADYDVPLSDRCLSDRLSRRGPGRRYVSELG